MGRLWSDHESSHGDAARLKSHTLAAFCCRLPIVQHRPYQPIEDLA